MYVPLVVLMLFVAPLPHCYTDDVHYITPDHRVGCASMEPCFTLDEYTSAGGVESFANHAVVQFMPGVHHLTAGSNQEHVLIRDRVNITLSGIETLSSETVDIVCSDGTGFLFINVSQLTISNLVFSYCGVGIEQALWIEILVIQTRTFFFFVPEELIALGFVNIDTLQMSNVVVQNSSGFGILGINILGNSTISESHFLYNNYYTFSHPPCRDNTQIACVGANLLLVFADIPECPDIHQQYEFDITSSMIAFGANLVEDNIGGGVAIALAQSSYGMHVNIDNATFIGNTASLGGNIGIIIYDAVDNSSVSIHNTYSAFGNTNFNPSILRILSGLSYRGAGMYFEYGFAVPSVFNPTCSHNDYQQQKVLLNVTDSWFESNNALIGGGMYFIYFTTSVSGIEHMIIIENTVISNNCATIGSAVFAGQISPISSIFLVRFNFKNCTFSNNSYPVAEFSDSSRSQQIEFDVLNAVQLISIKDIVFADCSFISNRGSAIYSYDSILHLVGDVLFEDNSAANGGAMSLHANSHLQLPRNTTVRFTRNTAQFRGGALYIASATNRIRSLCFWQIEGDQELGPVVIYVPGNVTRSALPNISELLNISMLFDGNDASESGTALFGGNIDNCFLLSTVNIITMTRIRTIFDQIFRFESSNQTKSTSLISSDAFLVCLCVDNKTDCNIHAYNVSVFPGNIFYVTASSHGQRAGLSSSVVYAEFLPPYDVQNPPQLGRLQDAQEIGNTCTSLRYSVSSPDTSLSMLLAIENSILQLQPTYINITLLPCPPGFVLSGEPPMCLCDPTLTAIGVTCDLSTQTVTRQAPVWIGNDPLSEESDNQEIIVHEFCPFDYCLPGTLSFSLLEQDTQCAFNRSGALCGRCQDNMSRQLGSSACAECSNYYLFLLIPFALAGIALVLLLFLLDSLTVSVGTINGLIFYANIIQFNRGAFFPQEVKFDILRVFIAWLNLDLGINTCFCDGLNSYALNWIQFSFPIYMFAIVGVITILSHYSLTISKMFGKNVVPVLATLIVLSFTKMLRTFIKMFSFTFITHSDGSVSTAWREDANILYFKGEHIPLFIVAVIGAFFIALPFTVILLCSQCLLAKSSHRPFKWVNKMKPIFDAYQGPYKDRFRNWTGFLLLTRAVLFTIISFVVPAQSVALLVIILAMQAISVFSWLGGGVYKSWPLNALEFSFFLNLGVLSATSLFLEAYPAPSSGLRVVGDVSVTIAFLEFVGIIVYATYTRISQCSCVQNRMGLGNESRRTSSLVELGKRMLSRARSSTQSEEEQVPTVSQGSITAMELVHNHNGSEEFSMRLRESLIESTHFSS